MSAISETAVRTVADQVCDRLRSELLAGEHASGTPLREEELAARFGVSRHPIRKSLQKLAFEGLLVAKPHCGVVVADFQSQHIVGLLTPMRVQLELYALELAFPNLTAKHREEWQAIVQRMERACEDGNAQAILDQDVAFHQRLLAVAGLEEMIPIWQAIYGRMRHFHHQRNSGVDDFRVIAFAHQRIVDTFFSNDLARAASDLTSHLENGEFNRQAKIDWRRHQASASRG